MERIQGLKEYTESRVFKDALAIPLETNVNFSLLAQGEYNINYLFTHPITTKKLLLRVNCGSQMHLEQQIEYEYRALRQLECSGRTPKAVWCDGSKEHLEHGIMVMEYLPGRALDYHTDMAAAAGCLADIHSAPILRPKELIAPENSLAAIMAECEEMFEIYEKSPLGEKTKKSQIRHMMEQAWNQAGKYEPEERQYRCCINTELNSTNFLISGDDTKDFLIDWEKPLYGDPAQDLGHFLAPTTTFWKTNVILTDAQVKSFISAYREAVAGRFPTDRLEEVVGLFLPITCMRGITWCAMAWVQYQQPDRLIFNPSTFDKLNIYISRSFLDDIKYRYGL